MPNGKPRNSSSEVPIDENEHFIKLLEKALKSENIINSLKHALVYDLQRDNAELKILLQEKYAKISELENRVDDLEQYTRIDDLIISGLTVRHRSYSSAVTHNNVIESQNAAFDDKNGIRGRTATRLPWTPDKLADTEYGNYCWYCNECTSTFPFSGITDAELIDENVAYENSYDLGKTQEKFTEFSGRSFKHPDDGQHDVDNNLNPDCNFYNDINYKCNYNTEQQCDAYVDDVHGLSIIHFNARSLNAIF